jgi:hypothetical protein
MMDRTPERPDEGRLEEWASAEFERAATLDEEQRLKILEELYAGLEAGLEEDATPRH